MGEDTEDMRRLDAALVMLLHGPGGQTALIAEDDSSWAGLSSRITGMAPQRWAGASRHCGLSPQLSFWPSLTSTLSSAP